MIHTIFIPFLENYFFFRFIRGFFYFTFKTYTTTGVNDKRVSTVKTPSSAREKKTHMDMVKTPGFTEISSFANRKIVRFYVKNINNIQNYFDFLRSIEPELNQILKTCVQQGAIKFNFKLEATYNRPNVPNSSEN